MAGEPSKIKPPNSHPPSPVHRDKAETKQGPVDVSQQSQKKIETEEEPALLTHWPVGSNMKQTEQA